MQADTQASLVQLLDQMGQILVDLENATDPESDLVPDERNKKCGNAGQSIEKLLISAEELRYAPAHKVRGLLDTLRTAQERSVLPIKGQAAVSVGNNVLSTDGLLLMARQGIRRLQQENSVPSDKQLGASEKTKRLAAARNAQARQPQGWGEYLASFIQGTSATSRQPDTATSAPAPIIPQQTSTTPILTQDDVVSPLGESFYPINPQTDLKSSMIGVWTSPTTNPEPLPDPKVDLTQSTVIRDYDDTSYQDDPDMSPTLSSFSDPINPPPSVILDTFSPGFYPTSPEAHHDLPNSLLDDEGWEAQQHLVAGQEETARLIGAQTAEQGALFLRQQQEEPKQQGLMDERETALQETIGQQEQEAEKNARIEQARREAVEAVAAQAAQATLLLEQQRQEIKRKQEEQEQQRQAAEAERRRIAYADAARFGV